MISMSLSSNTMPSFDMDWDPEFVNLDSRLTCVSCHQWLKRPYQTSCGHRICQSCFNKLEPGRGIPCPANEDGCETISRDTVYPDHSAAREVMQLNVFCRYKNYGCEEMPTLRKLKEHLEHCECVKPCKFCNERIPPDQLDDHLKNCCPEAPVTCDYCKTPNITRSQLDIHLTSCLKKPHRCKYHTMGCDVALPQPELTEHENSSSPKHLELFAMHVSQLGLVNARLHRQLQDAQSEVDTVKQQLSLCSRENDLLKQQLAELQNTQQQSEERQSKVVAGLKSRIEQMTGQIHVLEGKSSQELVQVRGKCSQLEERLNESGSRAQMDVGLPEDVRKKFISHDRTIGQHDVRLAELDLRLQCTETANYEGVLIWKISEYADRKRQASEGRILSLYSQPFYTSRYGYKMCARVYLNGDGVGRGTHLSLFFVVMQGDYDDILAWPFRQKVTLTLIDQRTNRRHQSDMFRPDPTSSSFQKPTSPMNIASGCPLFVSHEVLEDQREGLYLRNNSIFLKVVVDTSDLLNP